MSDRAALLLRDWLAQADIELNGSRPWDLKIKDDRACLKILRYHNLGLGEAFMDGWVECAAWDEFVTRLLRSPVADKLASNWRLLPYALEGALMNVGRKSRAFKVGEKHYDIGNDLYQAMLGESLAYTCGYWRDASDLDQAQEAKFDLVCRKIGLQPGMRVLDIGCGWGGFLQFAAERYGAIGTGVTVSKEQVRLAQERCTGLPVEIILQDYRDLTGAYDRVISLGMFEHVMHKNYRTFMRVVERVLDQDGLFLLHTIGGNASVKSFDPWMEKYVFPNSMLPSIAQIARASEGLFVMEDWHNFGAYYDPTLMAWHANVERHWPELSKKYDERFHRLWTYYLLTCAGSFRARKNQLWQIVFSKRGAPGGYQTVR